MKSVPQERLAAYAEHARQDALWRQTFRKGIAPQLPPAGLEALARALVEDDPRLIQGVTLQPPPLPVCFAWDVEAADPLAYCLWKGLFLESVADVEEVWARACEVCDALLGEPGAVKRFLNFWDETDRAVARQLLLGEVRREMLRRVAGPVEEEAVAGDEPAVVNVA